MSEHEQIPTTPEEEPRQELPSIGAHLRAEREGAGLSVEEVAAALKMSPRQVAAMEGEHFEELPGPAFVKGFLRNYGKYLGIDVEPYIAARWPAPATVELRPITNACGTMPNGRRRGGRRLPLIVVAVLVLALALGWYFDGFRLDGARDSAATEEVAGQQAVPSEQSALPEDWHAAPEEDELSAGASWADSPLIARTAELSAGAAAAAVESGGVESTAKETPATELSAADEAPPVAEPVAVEPAAAEPAPVQSETAASGPGRLVLRLRGDAWIQVSDTERSLYTGLSAAGSTRVVQGRPPFALVIGNAAEVELEYDGRVIDLKPHTQASGVARLKVE